MLWLIIPCDYSDGASLFRRPATKVVGTSPIGRGHTGRVGRSIWGKVVIFAAGTGNPFFTTDTAAALRGMEMNVDIVLKATKVDGVYTDDPKKNPDAVRYQKLTFDEAINKNLKVMDATAFTLCRDQNLQINVFSIFKAGGLKRVVLGEDEGTVVHG